MEPLLIVGAVVAAVCLLSGNEGPLNVTTQKGNRYRFNLAKKQGEWRAYIIDMPSYQGRSTSAHDTHRFFDSETRQHYVCFDPAPKQRSEAEAIAKKWAEKTDAYIRSGVGF